MIKLLTLLARKSDLTHTQFVQIWADEAPALTARAAFCRRYVQYRLHPDRIWPPGTPQLDLQLDGIEELWLDGQATEAALILGRRFRNAGHLDHLRGFAGWRLATSYVPRRITDHQCVAQ